MAALKKTSVLLALMFMVLAFTSTANAQLPLGVIQCQATPVTPLVRAEGVAEAAGDIDITCNNTPGVSDDAVQYLLTNLNVLATNVNFTNSIGLVTGGGDDTTEAVVIINSNHGTAPTVSSTLGGVGLDPRFPRPQYGELSGGTLLTWNGMQFPVPGAPNDGLFFPGEDLTTCADFTAATDAGCFLSTTTIKIGNIRVNVSGLASPAQVSVIVSMTGPTNIPIFPNVLNIALPLVGLTWGLGPEDDVPLVGLQCEDDSLHVTVSLHEGFASSFKTLGVPTFIPGNTQWESGYYSPGSGDGDGGATQGTRFKLWFFNVPDGVDVSVHTSVNNSCTIDPDDGIVSCTGGPDTSNDCSDSVNWNGSGLCLHLISGADAWGAGGSPATYTEDTGVPDTSAVSIDSDGMGMVVYEVFDADGIAKEWIDLWVWYDWEPDTGADSPSPGTSQISVGFAPLATSDGAYGFVADDVSPRPRFIDVGATPEDAISIRRCTTTLLFPWIVNRAGFDTGVAVSNTSLDWLGTSPQAGICTVHWHGYDSAGGTFPDTPSSVIDAGKQFVFLVSNEAPDFQGYIIIVCEFQFAHGYAYITDGFGGITTTAQGYLALVIHYYDNDGARMAAETLGH